MVYATEMAARCVLRDKPVRAPARHPFQSLSVPYEGTRYPSPGVLGSSSRSTRLRRTTIQQSKGATMLVLTRRQRESVRIGDSVTVTVLGLRGDTVRIGIEAPRAIAVHRQEIYARIQAEKQESSDGEAGNVTALRPTPPRA